MITTVVALTKGSVTYKEKSLGSLTLLWDPYPDQVNLFIILMNVFVTILASSGTFPSGSVSAGHKDDTVPSLRVRVEALFNHLYGMSNMIHMILQYFQSYN